MTHTNLSIPTHIVLEGACNARDLGGYPTRDGERTRRFAFVRCESPVNLSDADITLLIKLGVRDVIDLRGRDEVDREPNPFASVPVISLHHIPLLDIEASPHAVGGDMGDLYVYMLERCGERLREVFRTILAANRGVLYHCAAGKDRTGVVSALLLLLAGVDEALVLQEYGYTQTLLASWREQEARRLEKVDPHFDPVSLDARPEYLRKALRYLETVGGVHGLLREIGLDVPEIDALKARVRRERPRVTALSA